MKVYSSFTLIPGAHPHPRLFLYFTKQQSSLGVVLYNKKDANTIVEEFFYPIKWKTLKDFTSLLFFSAIIIG
jgi:hypothetical protein